MIYFNLIGPGRVGLALANALIHTQKYTLQGLYHPAHTTAQDAVKALGQGQAYQTLETLPHADFTLVTTPDSVIEDITKNLLQANCLKPDSIIVHFSGVLSSDVFAPLRTHKVHIASLHPLKAFTKAHPLPKNTFKRIYCGIEGDKAAIKPLHTLTQALGAHALQITPKNKAGYHAAACMASNYLVTLAAHATQAFSASGLSDDEAKTVCMTLMQTSLDNLTQHSTFRDALTGPLQRGDIQTITAHLSAIQSNATKTLYQTAGLATLPLTDLSPTTQTTLKALLNS